MIKVEFFGSDPIVGFRITGHSEVHPSGPEVICAGVSSAAYMTANTVTDVLGIVPELSVSDGDMYLKVKTPHDAERCRILFDGLRLHLSALAQDHKKYIKVINSEV